jgi:hypothetical protein
MPAFKLSPETRKAILERVFGSTEERKALLDKHKDVVEDIANLDSVRRLYVFGGSASNKPKTKDIDLLSRIERGKLKENTDAMKLIKEKHPGHINDQNVHYIPATRMAPKKTQLMEDLEKFAPALADTVKMLSPGYGVKELLAEGRKKYGPEHKWIRIAGAGGAAGLAGAMTEDEAEAYPLTGEANKVYRKILKNLPDRSKRWFYHTSKEPERLVEKGPDPAHGADRGEWYKPAGTYLGNDIKASNVHLTGESAVYGYRPNTNDMLRVIAEKPPNIFQINENELLALRRRTAKNSLGEGKHDNLIKGFVPGRSIVDTTDKYKKHLAESLRREGYDMVEIQNVDGVKGLSEFISLKPDKLSMFYKDKVYRPSIPAIVGAGGALAAYKEAGAASDDEWQPMAPQRVEEGQGVVGDDEWRPMSQQRTAAPMERGVVSDDEWIPSGGIGVPSTTRTLEEPPASVGLQVEQGEPPIEGAVAPTVVKEDQYTQFLKGYKDRLVRMGKQAEIDAVGVEGKELGLVADLSLMGSSAIASSLGVKALGLAGLPGKIASLALMVPVYVFSKGFITNKPVAESAKSLVPHRDENGLLSLVGIPYDPGEYLWWGGFEFGAPVILRAAGKGAGKIVKGVDKYASGPLRSVVKPLEPAANWAHDVITYPFTKEFIPSKKFPGEKRSINSYIEPAVDRLAKSDVPMLNTAAQTIRRTAVEKSHTINLGRWAKEEMAKLTPSERHEVSEGLRGVAIEDLSQPKAQEFLTKYVAGKKEAGLTKMYEIMFDAEFGKMIQMPFLDLESTTTQASIKRMLKVMDKPLKEKLAQGGTMRVKDNYRALDDIINNPKASEKMKQFAMDLYDLPANTTEMVFKASNRAGMMKMEMKLMRTPGICKAEKQEGYVMSKSGGLKGLYVPKDIELELGAIREIPKITKSAYNKYFLSPWKTSKIILRPATHVRNLFSNMVLNDWGGLPFYRFDVYLQALKEMRGGSAEFKKFVRDSGQNITFASNDIARVESGMRHNRDMIDSVYNTYQKLVEPAAGIYNAEETLFKYAKYLHNMEQGTMGRHEAIMDALKWTFNYAETTPLVSKMGTKVFGMPFVRWYSKALPLAVETAVKHPIRFYKWIEMGRQFQNHALSSLDIDDDEWDWIKGVLPDYMNKGRLYLPMPWRDDLGRLQLLNLTYMMPGLGDMNELFSRDVAQTAWQNPLFTTAATLWNKTKFSGAPLYYDWEEPTTKLAKVLSYAWEQFMPAVTPGGTDWNAIYNALYDVDEERPGPTIEQAIAGFFGFKLTPIDSEAAQKRSDALKQIHESERVREMQKELRKAKTDEQVDAILERYGRLQEKIMNDGELVGD